MFLFFDVLPRSASSLNTTRRSRAAVAVILAAMRSISWAIVSACFSSRSSPSGKNTLSAQPVATHGTCWIRL